MIAWDNESIAEKLLEYADLLEQQDANPYRVGAYRRAARVVATHPEPLTEPIDPEPFMEKTRYQAALANELDALVVPGNLKN